MNKKIVALLTGLLLLGMVGSANATPIIYNFTDYNNSSVTLGHITLDVTLTSGQNAYANSNITEVVFQWGPHNVNISAAQSNLNLINTEVGSNVNITLDGSDSWISGFSNTGASMLTGPDPSDSNYTSFAGPYNASASYSGNLFIIFGQNVYDSASSSYIDSSIAGYCEYGILQIVPSGEEGGGGGTAVPEPSTMLLLGSGLLGLVGLNRRRKA